MSVQCRTCAVKITNPNVKDLFDEDDDEILLNIEVLTGIRLNDEEHMPRHICVCCHLDLYHSIAFRERCLRAENYFQCARAKILTGDPLNTVLHEKVSVNESRTEAVENPTFNAEDKINPSKRNMQCRSIRNCKQRSRRKNSSGEESSAIETLSDLHESEAPSSHLMVSCSSSTSNKTEISSKMELVNEGAAEDVQESTSQQEDESGMNQAKRAPMGPKVFICDLCGHQSSNPKNLDIHILRHKGEKNFECEECGTKHYSKYLLQLHIRVKHQDEKPFKCRHCDQRFYSGSTRQRHEQVRHIRSWSYECKICGKKYNTKSCLNKHEFLHSGLRPYRCDLCNVAFPRKPGLRIHCRTKQHQKRASEALNGHMDEIKDIAIADENIMFPDSVIEQLDV